MTALEHGLTQLCSAVVIGVMLAICLRSKNTAITAVPGRRTYRIHTAWYVFCVLGGVLVAGLFAYASRTTIPENQKSAAWCSIISAVFFLFTAVVLRAASVTIDETTVTSTTLFGQRTVLLANIESATVVGLVAELKMRVDPVTQKRPRALTFLTGFRGLGELLATIRSRSGLRAPD